MKFRTDFVTNSSSTGFICFHVKSKILHRLFEEAGVPYRWLDDLSYLDYGDPSLIEPGVSITLLKFLDFWIKNEIKVPKIYWSNDVTYSEYNDVTYKNYKKLYDLIEEHAAEIDAEAKADMDSGDADSDAGGPSFMYSHLETDKGIGRLISFSCEDDYYGDDEEPSPLYRWALEHNMYDISNETPLFLGGYDEDLYFTPPYKEMEQSYEDVHVVNIGLESGEKCVGKTFFARGKLKRFGNHNRFKFYVLSQAGCISTELTKQVDYLVANKVDSMCEKAEKLGIQVLTEQEFIDRFGIFNT